MDWFLYDRDLCHERVNVLLLVNHLTQKTSLLLSSKSSSPESNYVNMKKYLVLMYM